MSGTVSRQKQKRETAKAIHSVLISRDRQFRDSLVGVLAARQDFVSLDMEIEVPFMEISDAQLNDLRLLEPEIIFLDLGEEPHIGLKFAQYLSETARVRALVAVGPDLGPHLLLNAMQSGISEYLPKPITAEALNGAIERLYRRTGRDGVEEERAPGKMYAVFSPKGGSGSTTLTVNLAIQIHRVTRQKTLILDLDLELGETALLLGIEPRFSVVDLVRNFHRADSGLLASYIERHESGVDLLSAPIRPADVELVSEEQIRKILQFLLKHYDYIIVDTPKSFGAPTLAAFDVADEVFLLTAADLPSLRNVLRCLPLLRSLDSRREDWIRLVLNRYESKGMISASEVEKMLGMKVFWKLRNDYEAVLLSANTGEPIVTNSGSDFARDVRDLGSELAGVPTFHRAPASRLKDVLDRLPRLSGRSRPIGRKAAAHE